MKKASFFALSSLLAISLLTGCGGGGQEAQQPPAEGAPKQKLIMATSADYKPYEFHDTSSGQDQIVGFDIDIANYISKELGFEYEIKDMDFNGLIPSLQSGRADFVMAGMTPKPERLENADFSIVYFEAQNTIVSKKENNLNTLEALKGKKVGVQLGSIQEGEAKNIEGIEVVSLNKIAEIIQEIKSNRIDAAIIEDTVAKGYVNASPELQFVTIPNSGPAGSAVAFPKGSAHVEDFNRVIKQMQENGEMEKLVKKWFEQ
ncbi:transporter substrate-binding domain-containing protein [Ammoniphilus sp. 3BR4]|uniref:transporter substrate-binding domain-containing protein n=1 Tax=Ammoniphilus sp. 3BR4 TaxID=3158265 RepID=UPI0034664F1F